MNRLSRGAGDRPPAQPSPGPAFATGGAAESTQSSQGAVAVTAAS
jgi:hypothetical protein